MYIAEISPAKYRGQMVSFNQLNIVVGISAAFFSNYLILILGQSEAPLARALQFGPYGWRWMLGLETLPALFYFACIFLVPESPRWLVLRGRPNDALNVIARATGPDEARRQIDEIKESIASEAGKPRTPLSELFLPAMRKVLVIGLVIAVIQQITGINAVFFYAPMIFEQSGIGTNAAFSQAVLVGLINLVFTFVAIGLVDKLGRKPLLAAGLLGITISMLVLGMGFRSATYTLPPEAMETLSGQVDPSSVSHLVGQTFYSDVAFKRALAGALGATQAAQLESELIKQSIHANSRMILFGILGFVASFAFSVGPVMWVLFSELFPNRVRALAISFVGFVNSAVSFTVQLVFPWELANFGSATTFLIYGAFAAIGFFFVLALLPETKGRSLEELARQLVKPDSPSTATTRIS
jgi:MFS family permease